jgi:diguanylate cyclase (GGDEF)-like protein
MVEELKIGIVYREKAPRIFADLGPEGIPWPLEFIDESAVLENSCAARRDFLAVFFGSHHEEPEFTRRLSQVFPGAEVLAYQNSAQTAGLELRRRNDGILIVPFPMSSSTAEYLLENFAVLKANRRELAVARHRTDELQEFFDSFVNMVESSWKAADRRLGMSILLNKLLRRVGAEECLLYLLDEGSGTVQRAYCTGNMKDIDLFDYHANSSILDGVLSSGTAYLNNNYCFELKVPFSAQSVFIRSILCLPLQRRGEKAGVIELINKSDGVFTPDDQALVQMLVDPLTVAIRTVRVFENAERLTITDDLTKLYNYRFLMQFLEAEVKRCLRYKKKVSLLFIDVDGFKRINDTFGHLVGSHALAEMGQVFRRILRETDIVGRYGGDEFVIVLPETPLNGAMVIAERIRKKVEDYEFIAQNLSIRLTVSLGVANCPKHTLTAEGLIKKADAAMYRAKELSKNSIKVAV